MRFKQTKIIATISDLRCDPKFIKELYDNGMNAVRLNTAHQTPDATKVAIDNIRSVSEDIAIIIDTKGPEVRSSKADGIIELKKGDNITVTYGPSDNFSTKEILYVSYEHFAEEVPVGHNIMIDDGKLELLVKEKSKDGLVCEVMNNGAFKSRKSVNVPEISLWT